jgi:hypothetical protein
MKLAREIAGAIVLLFVGGAVLGICAMWDFVARFFRRKV